MIESQTALDFFVTPDMSDDEHKVWNVLRFREGPASAIQVEAVAELVGIPARRVQQIVRTLIHERGRAIGTSMAEPYGWFLAVTHEQREAVADLHRRRALAELSTAAKILGIDRREVVRRFQTELDA